MSTDTFPNPEEVFQDRYRIVSVVNRGGFGRVYRATQIELNRDVAIKVLQPVRRDGMDADQEAKRLEIVKKRFEREAQLVSQLRDSHTVMMHDYGTTPQGLLYMVLEYVDGKPLSEVIEETGPMDPVRVVKIVRQVLSSLEEAHALGMLHRDIKPANIMLFDHAGRTDQVKVLDFGLAKSVEGGEFNNEDPDLTGEEVILGTPRYMSPEQIRGEAMGPTTDLYSLGLVLFEMLSGYKAVEGESTMNTLARHLNEIPIELPKEVKVPGALRATVNQMLRKNRSERPASAAAVLELLERWQMASLDVPVGRGEMFATGGHDVNYEFDDQKKKVAIYALGGVMAFFLLIGIISAVSGRGGTEQTAEAATNPQKSEEEPSVEREEAAALAKANSEIEPVEPATADDDPIIEEMTIEPAPSEPLNAAADPEPGQKNPAPEDGQAVGEEDSDASAPDETATNGAQAEDTEPEAPEETEPEFTEKPKPDPKPTGRLPSTNPSNSAKKPGLRIRTVK